MNNTTNKQKWKLPLPVLLTYLIVVTLVATGVSLSAYVTTADGMDAARVAKFEINISEEQNKEIIKQNFTAQIKPGENVGKFQIINNSEVAVEYEVAVISKTNNLPIMTVVDVKEENKTETNSETTTEQGTGTEPNEEPDVSNILAAGGMTSGNIEIRWPVNENSIEYAGKVDLIEITVTAEQID